MLEVFRMAAPSGISAKTKRSVARVDWVRCAGKKVVRALDEPEGDELAA